MSLPKIIRADFGSDLAVFDRYSFKEKIAGFLTLARPIFLFLTPINAASAAILSIRGLPPWSICLAGFFTGACAAAGVNIFNRFTDAERDKTLWPNRSIPSGRVKASQALLLSLFFYAAALALCWIYFNPTCFFFLTLAIILGSLYSSTLRDKIGYLSLPLIEGLIFLTGWASLSPETVFTSFLPWYLYLLGVVWQSSHILAHYALNIRFDDKGKQSSITQVLFSKPSAKTASAITMVLAVLLLLMSVMLTFLANLSYLYIIPVGVFGLYTIFQCRAFLQTSLDKEKMHHAWSSLSLFRMVISAAIILNVLVIL